MKEIEIIFSHKKAHDEFFFCALCAFLRLSFSGLVGDLEALVDDRERLA